MTQQVIKPQSVAQALRDLADSLEFEPWDVHIIMFEHQTYKSLKQDTVTIKWERST